MKKQYVLMVVTVLMMSAAYAQKGVESDDMYFTRKDRERLKEVRKSETAYARNESQVAEIVPAVEEEEFNPTDSYSARNVNPEYISRENSAVAQADNEDYFVNDYQFAKQNQLSNWNNNYNQWYNDSWYASNYYAPGLYSWNSRYYGGYYDPYSSWSNPWYNPYNQRGWSSSVSYYYGSRWNSGWGMNFGDPMYGGYYSPAMAGWYSPYYSPYGYSPYGNWYGRPGTVVIVDGNGRGPVYGKRPSRGSFATTNDTRVRSSSVTRNQGNNAGGRARQEAYYNRPASNGTLYQQNSRTNAQYNRSSWSNGNNNNSNSSWNNNSRSNSTHSQPARNHSSGSGSGSNGRGRGRD